MSTHDNTPHDNTPPDDTLADEVFVERDTTPTGADATAGEPTPTGEPTSAPTQALPTTPAGSEAGAEAGAGAPSTPASSPGTAVATAAPATGTAASDSATSGTASTEQQWLRGPAPFAIVLGLLGLFVAGAVLLAELTDLSMPWNDLGPWTVVAAGIVVVLVGAIGLRSSRRTQD
jgi:hypothetical protein